jgi:polyhydroxyalkanoate depolymerase
MWYESMEAQRRFVQSLCEWWMPDYRWPDRPCEPPPFGISSIRSGERSIPVVESVLDRTPFCELRHFARVEGAATGQLGHAYGSAASIFVCAPLAGHHAVMLREMIETLLQNADVYVTDWIDARDVPLTAGPFGLNDYILVLERFLRKIGSARLHVVAVCQATVPVLAASALLASAGIAEPLSLTLMGGPIDIGYIRLRSTSWRKHTTSTGFATWQSESLHRPILVADAACIQAQSSMQQ